MSRFKRALASFGCVTWWSDERHFQGNRMAGIKADPKQFWQRFIDALKEGLPAREDGKDYSNKEVEAHYGLKSSVLNGLFTPKGRNYQVKWSDAEMSAFNAGEPPWDIHKVLLASIMWGSSVSSRCRSWLRGG